ncbi:EGF domain-specific O-linked N-acetylglucosamine transferase-like [Varroa jacobsoni]|uniref:EGF domain-specific O-linked N-acetylglucosamine transferase-like n=1 Tax=Varroa jacobsoni TaxID=62625 RepID=UPI000BF2D3F6|nr:EGF domain-specific O-linked N-acetylglucosamine transferase-like [Varroa jacobsoni]
MCRYRLTHSTAFRMNIGLMSRWNVWFCLVVVVAHCAVRSEHNSLRKLEVPAEHLPLWAALNQSLLDECVRDKVCQANLKQNKCWGYEEKYRCTSDNRYHSPACDGSDQGWTRGGGRAAQEREFYDTADFGYIAKRLQEMAIVCRGTRMGDSVLECVDHARLCRAQNIFMDFSKLKELTGPIKYRDDVLGPGLIGGHCRLKVDLLRSLGQHKSPLQSWFAEIEHFTVLPQRLTVDECGEVIEEPTMLVKLDATVNMYHHFCDFVNLYATLHFNQTAFQNINVIVWDGYPYRSNFGAMWRIITDRPLRHIGEFKNKGKVCFSNLLLPFLPRMIFGLYYNMPLIPGCQGSGLMKAFREHTLHRLNIPVERPSGDLRVTFLSRSTNTRRVLNQDELMEKLNKVEGVQATKIDFNFKMDFIAQINISANTDLLIGVHGAGLTHTLFLPEWAAVFELYNCGDPNCYLDLARLAGKRYFTWEKRNTLEAVANPKGQHAAHEKFANYRFDVNEFIRIVRKAVAQVNEQLKAHTYLGHKRPVHDEM